MSLKLRLTENIAVIVVVVVIVAFSAIFMYSISSPFTLGGSRHWGLYFESVDWDSNTGEIKAYVVNADEKDITISQIYVNGTLDDDYIIVPQVLQQYQTTEIILSETFSIMPKEITIELQTEDNMKYSTRKTFIEFEMLGLYWDEEWGKIKVVVSCECDYPNLAFGEIYVNGTLDDEVVISKQFYTDDPRYDLYLSGTYLKKPTNMELRIVSVNGYSFELKAPFYIGNFIRSFWLDESDGQVKVVVYLHGENIPEGAFTYGDIYVNGTLDDTAIIYSYEPETYSDTYVIILSRVYVNVPSQVTIKVITHFGAFDEITTDDLWVRSG
ncbi:MAG: hypothetical protein P8Y18_01560 [Candidatus Bathyarchaeota archaeon]